MRAAAFTSRSPAVSQPRVSRPHGTIASAAAGPSPGPQQKQRSSKSHPGIPNHVPPRTQYAPVDFAALVPTRRTTSKLYQPLFVPSDTPSSAAQVAAALGIDAPGATKLLAAVPMYAHVPPMQIHEALAYLILLLGAPKATLLKLATRHPDLLVMPSAAKQADKLGFLCYLQQRPRLLKALTRPQFLGQCRPNNYLQQVCSLSKALGLTLDATITSLVACPGLITLTFPPELLPALAARLSALLRFHGQRDFLRSFVVQRPELLLMAAGSGWDELRARAEWLEGRQLLGRPLAAVPQLLETTVERLEEGMQGLEAVLDLPHDDVVKLAARQPLLLLTDAGSLDARVGTLAYLLELPRTAAQQLAVARPRLLTVDAGAMHSSLLLLRQVLLLNRGRLQELVNVAPQLLAQPPSRLRGNCLLLVFLVTTCPNWRYEFLRMSTPVLAWVLQQQELQMRRLLYLARTGRAMTVWMRATLMMEDKDFDEMFPGYTTWRKQRRPPFKLTKQQRMAFQEIINSSPPE